MQQCDETHVLMSWLLLCMVSCRPDGADDAGGFGVRGNVALLHSDVTVSGNGSIPLLRFVGRPQQQLPPVQQLHQLPHDDTVDKLLSPLASTDGSTDRSPYSPASSSPFTRLSSPMPMPARAAHETSDRLAEAAAAAAMPAANPPACHSPTFSSLSADTSLVFLNPDSFIRTAAAADDGLHPAALHAAAPSSHAPAPAPAEAFSGAYATTTAQEPADRLAQAAAEATTAQLRSWLSHLLPSVRAPTALAALATASAPSSSSSSSTSCLRSCSAASAAGAANIALEAEAQATTLDSLCFPLPCYPEAAAVSPVAGGLLEESQFGSDGGRGEASSSRGTCATVRLLVSPAAVAEAEAYHMGMAAGWQEGRAAQEQGGSGHRERVGLQEHVQQQEQRCGPTVRVVVSAPNCRSAWVDQGVAIQPVPSHPVQGDGGSGGTGARTAAAEAEPGGRGAGLVTFDLPVSCHERHVSPCQAVRAALIVADSAYARMGLFQLSMRHTVVGLELAGDGLGPERGTRTPLC